MQIPIRDVLSWQVSNLPAESEDIRGAMAEGVDFQALLDHAVYRRIVDWMEQRADMALGDLRARAMTGSDDASVSRAALKWAVSEELLKDFQLKAQQAASESRRLMSELGDLP